MLKANQCFKNVFFFLIIRLIYFHDSLNIIVTLAPGHEFFSAKCVEFP